MASLWGLTEFVSRVSREFGVPPPWVSVKRIKDVCQCGGYYDYRGEIVYIDEDHVSLDVVLHELAHHIQHVLFKEVFDHEEYRKPHCMRRFEVEAKAFASTLKWYYEGLWERLVEGVG
jgi:hypothetical protein